MIGEPVSVPARLSPQALEEYRSRLESGLYAVTEEADAIFRGEGSV